MVTLIPPGRRLSGAGLALGLLTAALAAVTLVDSAVGPAPADRAVRACCPPPADGQYRCGPGRAAPALRGRQRRPDRALGGEQLVAWWGPRGPSMSLIQVWHPRNSSVRANATSMGAVPAARGRRA